MSYNVDTTSSFPPSNARNTRAIDIQHLQKHINIPAVDSGKYSVVQVTNEMSWTQMYSIVLAQKIYSVDVRKFEGVIARAVTASVTGEDSGTGNLGLSNTKNTNLYIWKT